MPNLGFRDTGLRSTDKVTRGWGAITQRIRLENSITPLRENILQLSRSRKQCKEPYRRQLTPSTRRTLKPSVPGNTTERHRSARPLCKHLDTHRDPTLVLTARPPDSARNPTERTEKSIGLSTNDRKPDQPVFLSNGAIEERLSGTTRQLRTDGEDLPPPSPAERVRKIIRCRSDTTVGGKEHSKEKVIKKRGNIKRSESTGGGSKSGESSALQFVGSEEKNALKLKNERLSARPAQSPNRDASRKQSSPHSRCRLTLRRWKKGRGLWTRGCEQSKNESRKKTTSGDTRAARSALRRESFVSEKSQLRSKHSSQSRTWHSPKFDSPIKVEQEGSTSTRGNPTKCTTLSEPEEEPEESKQTILNSSLPQHSVPCTGSAVTADAADLSVSQFQHPGAPKVPFYKKHPEKTRDTQHCRNNGGTALKKADSFPDKSPSRLVALICLLLVWQYLQCCLPG